MKLKRIGIPFSAAQLSAIAQAAEKLPVEKRLAFLERVIANMQHRAHTVSDKSV